jgi:dCTP deaminase
LGVLSNTEIQRALDEARLVIEPRPDPPPGEDHTPYSTSAVDLRLSDAILVPRPNLGLSFDLRQWSVTAAMEAICDERTLPPEGWTLDPGRFMLGTTIERVALPLHESGLAARIEGRSSFARTGLLIHFTAPTIHAGFAGHITLELINLGPIALQLFPGMRICQLVVETVVGRPTPAPSRFHQQTAPSGRR